MPPRTNFDHYIAQHYIKRFGDINGLVYIGNIASRRVEGLADVSRVMGEFNWSVDQEIEDAFTTVETRVANAFRRLQEDPSTISGLSASTREGIKDFITIHYARSTGIHNSLNQSTQQFSQTLQNMAPPGFQIDSMGFRDASRPESLGFGLNIGRDFEPVYSMKGCVALITPPGSDFILGDNPLVNLTSQEYFYMKGAIFADETYFWFPLNPSLGLFFAKDLGNKIYEGNIKRAVISENLVNTLNRAQVYLAVDNIAGNRRGLVRNKLRLENIGTQRNEVQQFGNSPLIFNFNKAMYEIPPPIIEELRSRF